jgi:uncharacterized protein (TIGR02300 family)
LTPLAKPELGTKRVCPTTGRKFYDLNRDPIVSPYTGQVLPRSLFEPLVKGAAAVARAPRVEEEPEVEAAAPDLVSLEDVEAEEKEQEVAADDDVEIADGAQADDTFLEEEEEGDDNVVDLIDGDIEEDEEA